MKYSEIIKLNNALEGCVSGDEYKIVILSNIMVHQAKDICEYLLRSESLNAKVALGEYDNIVQDSEKFKNANAIIFFWEVCNFVDGLQYRIDLFSEKDFNGIVDKVKFEIDIVLSSLANTPLVVINKFSSLIFDQFNLSVGNLNKLTNILNKYIERSIGDNFIIFDVDLVISRLSVKSATDLRYYYSSKTLYSIEFYKEYFESIRHVFLSATGRAKKALVFDCDNTLWKGVLGEDGFDNIKIYKEVQHLALQLSKKGVIIGLCSKNNPKDVDHVLKNHPEMILRDDDIVIKKVNWHDKVSNLQAISKDLNIGMDSIVFIDDSSFEVGLVKEKLPVVKVFQVPIKEYEYGLMMKKVSNFFYNSYNTNEDRIKTKMYKDQVSRSNEKNEATNIEDYLKSLEIIVTVYVDNLSQVSRISQLTQKTNQFNLTTKRYSESEIKNFILNDNKVVVSIGVDDKYGASGLTGLAILCKKTSTIDTLLLSCRVLGRNIEYKFMDIIVNIASQYNFEKLKANYIKTKKNQQVEYFYSRCGFNGSNKYSLKVDNYKFSKTNYIRIQNGR